MTAKLPIQPSALKPSPIRFVKWGVGLLIAGVAAWFLWQWANDMSGIRREAPKVPTIIPLPPPPPPPPPPPEKPPEPETPVEEKIVEPEPTPEPEDVKPAEEAPPSPADDLAKPMSMDADAQAGEGGVAVGKGNGMAGAGGGRLGNGTYSQFLAASFQRLLRENPELRSQAYKVQADVWLSTSGEISRVELAKSSGNPEVDSQVLAVLRSAPRLEQRPPATYSTPMRVSLQGRRPG
ncbi:energy transducer TonB [Pseudomonas sp. PB120]|uniref:energy transducer TonB family protein n=1 Tax=Pseudomonas sp. PB120 TaxID=2494700 RepID=UPI0012FD65CE|nr:energy transducer TonB [Pseudomonas sp. PB120]MVV47956.1 energy transducer TonB [Pseudomonas sp. PB120]